MGWEITTGIRGGHAYSAARIDEYSAAAHMLDTQCELAKAAAASWDDAVMQLSRLLGSAPACAILRSADIASASDQHETLAFGWIRERCREHADHLAALGNQLAMIADLLIRAHSLYSQADTAMRTIVGAMVEASGTVAPRATALGIGLLAAGGIAGQSLREGHVNPAGALRSTAWAQEGLMRGLSNAMTGRPPYHGSNVGIASETISRVSGPINDHIQGDTLTLSATTADSGTFRDPHSVGEALDSLRFIAERRFHSSDTEPEIPYGTIAIQRYATSRGAHSWLVSIPGTDGMPDSPFGWEQNLELMSASRERRMRADSSAMVVRAMRESGIKPDEPVAIIGHSQGGIVAAAIASDNADEFSISHIVTAGSPVANHPIPPSTWVTSIEIDDELVAALDGAPNPATDHWLTIRGTKRAGDGPAPETSSCSPKAPEHARAGTAKPCESQTVSEAGADMEISHSLKYHQAAYRNAMDKGHGAVTNHERHFRSIVSGSLEETTLWQGRMTR
ncbi:MAG: alpha/beta hydrolase [Bifidobacterium sp.]|jgi:pimeloyl-ACP methyl ester carboxylesterase